jgi:hypothetical protein
VVQSTGPVEFICHLLDSHGRIVWRHKFLAHSDAEAVAAARAFLRDRIDSTCVFELWQDQRYISCENDALIVELQTASKLVLPESLGKD